MSSVTCNARPSSACTPGALATRAPMATHNPSNMRWDGQMSANTWALTLVLHRTQRVADEAINRALDGILILAAFRFQNLFSTRETTPGSCNNTLRRPLRHGAQRPRTSGGRPAALRVTGDAARRLRYPSRAKRTKPSRRLAVAPFAPRRNVTKAECPDWKRAYAPSTAHISPFTARCSGCGSPSAPSWQASPGVQAEEGQQR